MDQNLSGRGDLLLGDHGSGLVELVVAGTLEEIGVGAMGLGVGGVEHLRSPKAHLQLWLG